VKNLSNPLRQSMTTDIDGPKKGLMLNSLLKQLLDTILRHRDHPQLPHV
jgi:hypothetical protein